MRQAAEFKCDSDDSDRAGGEEAAARATTSQAKMFPANRHTSYHPLPCRQRESVLCLAGVVPCRGERKRQYAIKASTRSGARASTCQICLVLYISRTWGSLRQPEGKQMYGYIGNSSTQFIHSGGAAMMGRLPWWICIYS